MYSYIASIAQVQLEEDEEEGGEGCWDRGRGLQIDHNYSTTTRPRELWLIRQQQAGRSEAVGFVGVSLWRGHCTATLQ